MGGREVTLPGDVTDIRLKVAQAPCVYLYVPPPPTPSPKHFSDCFSLTMGLQSTDPHAVPHTEV